ncbi:MAG: anaerobic sulfatase maturase [Lentisphaerae bacterium]|nr:anaerobic sulfatase maturase [Lentisphaerota bacterium]
MNPFSLLVKPTSADCNLRCRYCFYLEKAEIYPDSRRHRMSDAVLERMIASYLETKQPCHAFGWQGGEPTLMGLDFFKRVTDLQSSIGRPGTIVANGFQTNGVLLDDDWAKHFAQYNFLVGVSVDGPAKIHDRFRVDAGGRGTHSRVLAGIGALRRNGAEFNVLTLVSQSNVAHPEAVYDSLCDMGVLFHQYIECVEFDARGRLRPFAITGREWGEFLCRIFDRWIARDAHRVSVRLFDTILTQMVDGASNTCAAGCSCDRYFVVEHNGDIYPCDFNVLPELRLGNVQTEAWDAMQTSTVYRRFAAVKSQWNASCDACPWLRFCHGDCPKNRPGRIPGSLSHLCDGWRRFYAHAVPRLLPLAEEIRRGRAESR